MRSKVWLRGLPAELASTRGALPASTERRRRRSPATEARTRPTASNPAATATAACTPRSALAADKPAKLHFRTTNCAPLSSLSVAATTGRAVVMELSVCLPVVVLVVLNLIHHGVAVDHDGRPVVVARWKFAHTLCVVVGELRVVVDVRTVVVKVVVGGWRLTWAAMFCSALFRPSGSAPQGEDRRS